VLPPALHEGARALCQVLSPGDQAPERVSNRRAAVPLWWQKMGKEDPSPAAAAILQRRQPSGHGPIVLGNRIEREGGRRAAIVTIPAPAGQRSQRRRRAVKLLAVAGSRRSSATQNGSRERSQRARPESDRTAQAPFSSVMRWAEPSAPGWYLAANCDPPPGRRIPLRGRPARPCRGLGRSPRPRVPSAGPGRTSSFARNGIHVLGGARVNRGVLVGSGREGP
jgi:hypothetical protein